MIQRIKMLVHPCLCIKPYIIVDNICALDHVSNTRNWSSPFFPGTNVLCRTDTQIELLVNDV